MRELTTLRTTVSKAHDALDLAGVSRGGTVEDRIARLALAQKPGDATRWAVVKAVVEEMGDEAVDIDATVPASVVRVALAALRAVVS